MLNRDECVREMIDKELEESTVALCDSLRQAFRNRRRSWSRERHSLAVNEKNVLRWARACGLDNGNAERVLRAKAQRV